MATSTIVSEQFIRLLDKRLHDVLEGDLSPISSMIEKVFGSLPSDSAWEEFYDVGAVPDIPRFNGKLEFLGVSPGYLTRIEPAEFAGGIQIEKKFYSDKKYGVLDDLQGGLSKAFINSREKAAVKFIAGIFTTSWDFMTSEEGVSIASSSHTTKSGASTATGFSNAGTSAFSKTALAASWIAARRMRNDIGNLFEINPDTILCPDSLYDTVWETIHSSKDPDAVVATNRENAQTTRRWNVIPWQLWDDYSTTSWGIVDMAKMKKYVKWINRQEPESETAYDFHTKAIMQSIYGRFGWGARSWRFGYFHNV